jgi:hypothetical protein
MRKLEALLIAGLFSIAMGCGGNGGNSTSPTGSSSGGATGGSSGGATATGGSGGGTGTGACVLPSCLKNLGADCVETGACTTQTDLATGSSNTCYANGVKEINIHDVDTDNRSLTVKKGSSTCFSTAFNGNDVYVGMGSVTVKDASGATVASVRLDDTDDLFKVTCTGGQEVSLDKSCKSVWPISGLMGTSCSNEGTCTP